MRRYLFYVVGGLLYLGLVLGCTFGGEWLSEKLLGRFEPGFFIGMFAGVLAPFYGDVPGWLRRRSHRSAPDDGTDQERGPGPEAVEVSGLGESELRSALSSHLAELAASFGTRASEARLSFPNPDPSLRAGKISIAVRRSEAGDWAFDVEVESPEMEGNSSETTQALGTRGAVLATLRQYAADPSEIVMLLGQLAESLGRFEHPYTGDEQREGAVAAAREGGKWKLVGYDTFASEWYGLGGEFDDEKSARKAARRRLAELETTQPTSSSGGQDGIQDRVYVIGPDGTSYRVT